MSKKLLPLFFLLTNFSVVLPMEKSDVPVAVHLGDAFLNKQNNIFSGDLFGSEGYFSSANLSSLVFPFCRDDEPKQEADLVNKSMGRFKFEKDKPFSYRLSPNEKCIVEMQSLNGFSAQLYDVEVKDKTCIFKEKKLLSLKHVWRPLAQTAGFWLCCPLVMN